MNNKEIFYTAFVTTFIIAILVLGWMSIPVTSTFRTTATVEQWGRVLLVAITSVVVIAITSLGVSYGYRHLPDAPLRSFIGTIASLFLGLIAFIPFLTLNDRQNFMIDTVFEGFLWVVAFTVTSLLIGWLPLILPKVSKLLSKQ